MFNEVTFREILLPSQGNVNDYVAQIKRKYADLQGNNKTYGQEEVFISKNLQVYDKMYYASSFFGLTVLGNFWKESRYKLIANAAFKVPQQF